MGMARLAKFRRRRASRWRVTTAELRLTMLLGLLLGFVHTQAELSWTGPGGGPVALPEPDGGFPESWRESARSRDLLRGQEDAPPAYAPESGAGRNAGAAILNAAAVRVIDGDTFRYGGDTIRIADIDTPETHPPRCAHEAELGARATQRLAALLAAGPFELQRYERDTDRYGRKLRIVVRDGQSLGGILVAEGLAREWSGRRQPWCA